MIKLYWKVIFDIMQYFAYRQYDTSNPIYQLALWLIRADVQHTGGSWDGNINPD